MLLQDYVFLKAVLPMDESCTLQMQDMLRAAKSEETGVVIKDRVRFLKSVKNCFVGREFITWISTYLNVERHISLRIGSFLLQRGYIAHATKDIQLKDDANLYKFIFKREFRKRSLSDNPTTRQIRKATSERRLDVKKAVDRLSVRFGISPQRLHDSSFHLPATMQEELAKRISTTFPSPEDYVFTLTDPSLDLVSQLFGPQPVKKYNSDIFKVGSPTYTEESESCIDLESEIPEVVEYEVMLRDIRIDQLDPLFLGISKRLSRGKTRPYCKIIMNKEVFTSETQETLNPRWFNENITIRTTSFPITCTVVVLDAERVRFS
jgi:hypothetical protein